MHLFKRRDSRSIMLATAVAMGLGRPAMALVAFPGADGFGADALGGRGGAVYHVTNLTDNTTTPAAGSFRAVLAQIATDETRKTNPITAATVVFDVGGTIVLTSNLDVKGESNITIAGQTAPGPGISMVGYKFDVTSSQGTKFNDITSNIVIRYLASRRGNTINSANDDSIGVLGSTSDPNHNTHDVILDHVTASWGMDEDLSVTDAATNVTVQNSIISEALESGHQFGSLIRPRFGANVSYVGNLYADNQSRNPRPGSYNNSTLNFDFRDNTVYNWGDRAGYTGGASEGNTEFVNMNYTGNYLIAGPSTPLTSGHNVAFLVDTSNGTKDPLDIQIYQANNITDLNKNGTADGTDIGWSSFARYDGTTQTAFAGTNNSTLTTVQEASPFAYSVPGTATTDPTIAYEQTVASAGTTPWNRNPSDARVIGQIANNTGAILLTAPTAEYNALVSQAQVTRPAGFDTDQDGMPDAWETQHNMNPSVADNNTVVTSGESASMAGYTWLEVYLNDLTLQAAWNGGTSGTWDGIMNWNGQLPNLQDSTAAFGNVGGAAAVDVESAEHVGQLSFDNPSGYTITGGGSINMDVLSHNNLGYATVTVNSGNHTIGVGLNLISDTQFTINNASLLDVTGALSAAGRNVSLGGGGTIQFGNLRAASLTDTGGTVRIRQNGSANAANGISVLGAFSSSGSGAALDLTNNALVLPYASGQGSATMIATRAMLASGQLTSSVADSSHRLGYIDNASLGNHNLGGLDPGTNSGIVEFLTNGDLNFSGATDHSDFLTFQSNFGATSGDVWAQGDLDYNGTVDVNDWILFAHGLLASGSPITSDELAFNASLGNPVALPEPAMISLLGLGGVFMVRRRRARVQATP